MALARDFEWDANYLFNFDELLPHLKPKREYSVVECWMSLPPH